MVKIVLNNCKLCFSSSANTIEKIYEEIHKKTGLNSEDFYLLQNGKKLQENFKDSNEIHAILRLVGGKGGFGSMLRAIGAQIEKTTNREACRDLSGRRLRDINEEKRYKAWLEKQKEQQEDPEEKFQKKIGKLMAKPKHEFKDDEYEAARTDLTQNIDEAVEVGFRKALEAKKEEVEALKRKAEEDANNKKKKKKKTATKGALWLGADLSSSSDTDSNSESEEGAGSSSSSKGPSTSTTKEESPKDTKTSDSNPTKSDETSSADK